MQPGRALLTAKASATIRTIRPTMDSVLCACTEKAPGALTTSNVNAPLITYNKSLIMKKPYKVVFALKELLMEYGFNNWTKLTGINSVTKSQNKRKSIDRHFIFKKFSNVFFELVTHGFHSRVINIFAGNL